jgi:hypothetical protein
LPFKETRNYSNGEECGNNSAFLQFTESIWIYVIKKLQEYPRYDEFKDIFEFDLKQMINSIYHSYLINTNPNIINLKEAKVYGGHNMAIFLCVDIDLMASPKFDKRELPWVRDIVWHAQQMARIGNWLSTWEREIWEMDYTSGIFAFSIMNKLISLDEIYDMDENTNNELIERIKKSEAIQHFLQEWKGNYEEIEANIPHVKSINVKEYLEGLELMLRFHLASSGLK